MLSVSRANAYVGPFAISQALDAGAQIVVTGRSGDPALFVGSMAHACGWAEDDWSHLGRGTAIGHMLECAGQLTGGYFADPGYKDARARRYVAVPRPGQAAPCTRDSRSAGGAPP